MNKSTQKIDERETDKYVTNKHHRHIQKIQRDSCTYSFEPVQVEVSDIRCRLRTTMSIVYILGLP